MNESFPVHACLLLFLPWCLAVGESIYLLWVDERRLMAMNGKLMDEEDRSEPVLVEGGPRSAPGSPSRFRRSFCSAAWTTIRPRLEASLLRALPEDAPAATFAAARNIAGARRRYQRLGCLGCVAAAALTFCAMTSSGSDFGCPEYFVVLALVWSVLIRACILLARVLNEQEQEEKTKHGSIGHGSESIVVV